MTENQIEFNFHARYYKLGEINSSTHQIWFVLHGYGQLAQYFIRKFRILESKNICVIAPEGLSRFYLEPLENSGRKNNRVGATWMTRENRETDIANYLTYLDSILQKEVKDSSVPVTILGFSQGSATASRWAVNGHVKFERLILWAGILPPDMNLREGSKTFQGKKLQFVFGTRDPFLTDNRFTEMRALTEKFHAAVEEISFEGEHDIDEGTLLRLVS